jgi:zinc finger protein
MTKILLTKIPHYKEVILMSFNCTECGFTNNEIQSGSQIQEQGIRYKVKILTREDLSRQIVKSDYATLTVPEIDLEIPPASQKGGKTIYFAFLPRV